MITDFSQYHKIIVSFSGGKDSLACLLYLLSLGVPKEQIELWHQCIDGRGEQHRDFFDWKSTDGYVKAIANHFGIKLCWSWRDGGMHREMHRENQKTGDVYYQYEGGELVHLPTVGGKESTRHKFPAKSASLNTRWCSAYLKIDVGRRVISNHPDLTGTISDPKSVLFITGERREESTNRSKYPEFEEHTTSTRARVVHQWRPVIDWTEQQVWDIIRESKIVPHAAYYLGFPRLSCNKCIFFTPDHWATLQDVEAVAIDIIDNTEKLFDFTMDNKAGIREVVKRGTSRITDANRHWIPVAINEFTSPIITDSWVLPCGAFTGNGGGSI